MTTSLCVNDTKAITQKVVNTKSNQMKKLAISVIGLLTLLIGLYSCTKGKEQVECKDCIENFENKKISVLNKSFAFLRCKTKLENGITFYYADVPKKTLLENTAYLSLTKEFSDNEKIASLVLFYKNQDENDEFKIDDNLKGCLVYYTKDSRLYTRMYNYLSSNFQMVPNLSTTSHNLVINDLTAIASLNFNDVKSVILLKSPDELANTISDQSSLLSIKLQQLYLKQPQHKIADNGGTKCWACGGAIQGGCFSERGAPFRCGPSICPFIKWNPDDNNDVIVDFNYDNTVADLRGFRDHYLINSERGQVYISDYEYFSNKIEIVDNISVNDIVTIVTEINNYVVPVILRLKQNPNSIDILYDDLTKNHVIGVLNIAKNYFTDDISVEKINSYILFVNQNVNQPIASIHALFI